jgi:hypothetical protein
MNKLKREENDEESRLFSSL